MTAVGRLCDAALVAALVSTLLLALGCRAADSHEELQTLAGSAPQEAPAERTTPGPPSVPSSGGTPAASRELDEFPLVGSVFPGLGGRLHSAFCDPASDSYSTCI